MDQLGHRLKQLTVELKEYIETRLELLLLDFSEQITSWLGQTIQNTVGILLLAIGFFFGAFALAIYLGDVLGNESLGYLIVSIPFLLIGTIFAVTSSKGLATKVQNQFMKEVIKAIDQKEEKAKQLPEKSEKEQISDKN